MRGGLQFAALRAARCGGRRRGGHEPLFAGHPALRGAICGHRSVCEEETGKSPKSRCSSIQSRPSLLHHCKPELQHSSKTLVLRPETFRIVKLANEDCTGRLSPLSRLNCAQTSRAQTWSGVFRGLPHYAPSRVPLAHSDLSLLPKHRIAWAAQACSVRCSRVSASMGSCRRVPSESGATRPKRAPTSSHGPKRLPSSTSCAAGARMLRTSSALRVPTATAMAKTTDTTCSSNKHERSRDEPKYLCPPT